MKCPTIEEIIETNKRLIKLKKITKAEKHELIKPKEALQKVLNEACSGEDTYQNASILLKELNTGHFFGSANKRTSFLSAINYLKSNNKEIPKKTEKEEARFLLKVRESKTSIDEIKRWLKS